MKNIGVSVYERIKKASRAQGVETSVFLRRYVQERLLHRISISRHADEFCLKGGILLAAYNDGDLLRPTEDIDFNGFDGAGDVQKLEEVLRDVLSEELPEDDGVTFEISSMRVLKDRTGIVPGGKVSITAMLHTAKVPLKVDVGFGNVITPDAKMMEIPTLLGESVPRPVIKSYPLETVIAEKLHAMAQFGSENTRVKDHFDLLILSRIHEFDGQLIVDAIRKTFVHQQRELPEEIGCLTESYARQRVEKWEDLVETTGIDQISFPEAMDEINRFLMPLVAAARSHADVADMWKPGIGWEAAPIARVTA